MNLFNLDLERKIKFQVRNIQEKITGKTNQDLKRNEETKYKDKPNI